MARLAVPPRRQRPRGRGRRPWRLLEEESGSLADVVAAASWRPSRAPPVAAVLGLASPARFSRVSVVGRAAPLRGQRHQRGRCRRRRRATSTLDAVRGHGGRPAAPPVPPRESITVAVP